MIFTKYIIQHIFIFCAQNIIKDKDFKSVIKSYLKNNSNSTLLDSSINPSLSSKLNITIPKDLRGVYYSTNSRIAQNIIKDKDFKSTINSYLKNNLNQNIPITFNSDANLKLSVHNGTLTNVHYDKNGNLYGIIYDVYDFKLEDYGNDFWIKVANNAAWFLQLTKSLEKYYLLIQIKIPNS